MRRLRALGLLVALLPAAIAAQGEANVRPVTQQMLTNPDPADWLMWRRTYNGWGYSPLDQVNRQNVRNLQLVWTYALEPHAQGLQAEPLVHDGVIYTRHPSELLTAHNAATGDLIWQYRRPLPKDVETSGYIAHRGRGLAIFGNKLLNSSTDGYVYALDPRSGRLLWETLIGPSEITRHQPSGALTVYNGVVVVPFNCGNNRSVATCHLSAYDADTGTLVWRWYSSPTTGDPLNDTWGPEPQKYPREARFNVSPWMTPAVDVEQGLFVFGVGSTAPMQPDIVGSKGTWPDRLFHNSTVALDYRTGRMAWWAQHTSDMHNDDSVYDRLLVDAPVNPTDPNAPWLGRNGSTRPAETRKLVVGSFSKDGIFYAYDRTNGEFLYARETAPQDVVLSYDGKTGAYRMNPANKLTADTQRVVSACKENRTIPQGAYSPLTNAYYVPVWAGCADFRTTSATPVPRQGYNITTVRSYVNPKAPTFGRPEAIDVTTGKTLWRLDRRYPLYGMLTTGGGLLFAADTNRRFYALDQWTGKVLWQTILNGLSDMAPITYSVNGRQYIAVISPGGTSGARGHLARVGIRVPTTGQAIFVFALPEG